MKIFSLSIVTWERIVASFLSFKETASRSWPRGIMILFLMITTSFVSQAQSIVWSGSFTEAPANDGSIVGTRTATLSGDTYIAPGALTESTHYTVANVPSGLTVSIVVDGTSLIATVTLTSNASPHTNVENTSSLTVTFLDVAFTGGSAAAVANSSDANGVVEFIEAPAITIDAGTLPYVEGTPVVVDVAGTLNDPDGDVDWDGGTLVVQITLNNEAADEISMPDNPGNINTVGMNLFDNVTQIGTLSASEGTVTDGTALTITFDSDATNALVQEVLQTITYDNTSNTPGTSNRTITFTATDAGGLSVNDARDVSVTGLNDPPTVSGNADNATFDQGGSAVSIWNSTAVSTVEAAQTITDFVITVTNVADGAIAGQDEILTVDGTAITLDDTNSGTTATNSLGYTVALAGTATITFTGGTVSTTNFQTLLNTITYSNSNGTPSVNDRVVTLSSITDSGLNGLGNVNVNTSVALGTSTVSINATPVISIDAGTLAYTEGTPVVVDAAGTLNDTNGDADWDGGTLVVQITANNEAADELSMPDNPGNINTVGVNLFDNVTQIGTLSASEGTVTNGTALTITFDSDATNALVQEVLQTITYDNTSNTPGTLDRTITFTATDAGLLSVNDARTISVTALNDEPTFTATGDDPTFDEGGSAVGLYSSSDVNTIEGDNVISFVITVTNVTDGTAGDAEVLNIDGVAVSLEDASTANDQVGAIMTTFDYDIVRPGGNVSEVTISDFSITEANFELLMNGITYENSATPPSVANRVVTITTIQDAGGSAGSNDDLNDALSVASTVSVNANPVISIDAVTLAYTEGTPVAVDAAGTLNDANGDADWDGGTLVVQITANNEAADELSMPDNPGNINTVGMNLFDNVTQIGTLSASEGTVTNGTALTITFDSDATNALVQEVLQTITYDNTSNTPGTLDRTITFTATDAGGLSANDARVVSVTALNDPPTLDGTENNPGFTEGTPTTALWSTTTISTVEAAQSITAFEVELTNVTDGTDGIDEVLNIDGVAVTLDELSSGSGGTTITFNYDVVRSGNTSTVTVDGYTESTANIQTVIESITYTNNSQDPSTTSRVATIASITDSGLGTGGNVNTNTSVALATSTVTITPINDQPTLGGTANSPGFTEGTPTTALWSSAVVSTIETGQTLTQFTLTVSNVADGSIITTAQDELSYDHTLASEGTFEGGGGYLAAETITLNDGTVVQVDVESGGEVAEFTVLTAGSATGIGVTLTQTSTSGSGAGFTLTPNTANFSAVVGLAESLSIDGVTVTLEDLNSATGVSGSTFGTFDYSVAHAAGTSTVTISAITASEVQLQTVINGITYSNASDNPSTTSRQVTITSLTDSGSNAGANDNINDDAIGLALSTVAITGVNDEPVLIAGAINPTFTQGDTPIQVFELVDINTIEGDNVISFTVEVSNVSDGTGGDAEILNIDGIDVSLENGSMGLTQVGGNITFDYAVTQSAGTSTVVVSNFSGTEATLETVFNGITYENTATPVTNGTRGIAITTIQDAGAGGDPTNDAIAFTSNVVVSAPAPPSTLNLGDIVVIGISGDGDDEFAWVPLVDIPAGEVIYFTNSGHDDAGVFVDNANHWVAKFTTPAGGIAKGTKMPVHFDEPANGDLITVDPYSNPRDTDLGDEEGLWLYNQGDQILVFQSTDALTATFTQTDFSPIFAATTNSTVWEYVSGNDESRYTSDLYTGLTNTVNAVAVGKNTGHSDEWDNSRYTGPTVNGTRAEILAEVANNARWTGDDGPVADAWTSAGTGDFHVNEAPEFTALTGLNPTYEEDQPAELLFSGSAIDTDETGQNLVDFTLTITNVTDGASAGQDEIIRIDGTDIGLNDTNSGTTTGGNLMDYSVSLSGGTATLVVDNFTIGAGALATIINAISYRNASQNPTVAPRVVTFTGLSDTDGFTSPTNATPSATTSTVTITPVNDEPTFSATADNPTFLEGGGVQSLFNTSNVNTIEGQNVISFVIEVTNVTDGQVPINAQTETSYDDAPTSEGTFTAGTGYVAAEVITLSDGTTVTVNAILLGAVTSFTVNSAGSTGASSSVTLTQTSTTGIGTGFTLTPQGDNLVAVPGFAEILNVDGIPITLDEPSTAVGQVGTILTSFNYDVARVANTSTVTFSAFSITEANFESLIDGITYQNNAVPPVIGNRVATITTIQDGGGTPNGGDDINNAVGVGSTINVDALQPLITDVLWLDNVPAGGDGDIDQVQLTFDVPVDFTDADGPGPLGLDIFTGIAFSTATDYSTFVDNTVYTLNLATPITGTSLPVDTLTYTSGGGPNATIVRDQTALEMEDGEVGANGGTYTDGAAPFIINTLTLDVGSTGNLNAMEVQFSEAVTNADVSAAVTASDFRLATDGGTMWDAFDGFDPDVTDIAAVAADNDEYVRLTIGTPVNVSGTGASVFDYSNTGTNIDDSELNALADIGTTATTDGADPIIVQTLSLDGNGNGVIEAVEIQLSEPITDGDVTPGDFSLSTDGGSTSDNFALFNPAVTNIAALPGSNDAYFTLTITTFVNVTTTGASELSYTSTTAIDDADLNQLQNFSGLLTTDGADPLIMETLTLDVNVDGDLDAMEIRFSEDLTNADLSAAVAAGDFRLATDGGTMWDPFDGFDPDVTDIAAVTGNDDQYARLTIATPVNVSGTAASVFDYSNTAGDINDVDLNFLVDLGTTATTDGAPPVIIDAITIDVDLNGRIDGITVFASEIVDASSVFDGTTFVVDGGTYTTPLASNGTPGDNEVDLVFDEILTGNGDTGATPDVTLNATKLTDGTNSLPSGQTFMATRDGAAPAITDVEYQDADENGFIDRLILTYSESVTSGTVNQNVLNLSNPGDFVGANFAVDATNASFPATTSLFDITESSAADTREDLGTIALEILSGFSITDGTNPNTPGVTTAQGWVSFTDGAAPAIRAVATLDADLNGRIDGVNVTLTEDIVDGSSVLNGTTATVGTYASPVASTGPSPASDDDDFILIVFSEDGTGTGDTDALPGVVLADSKLSDGTNINDLGGGFDYTGLTTDEAAPAIVTMEYQDGNEDGQVDRFELTFSENVVSPSSVTENDLQLTSGGDFTGAAFGAGAINRIVNGTNTATMFLGTVSPAFDTEDTGGLAVSVQNGFSIEDAIGNTNAPGIPPTAQPWIVFPDGAAPLVIAATTDDILPIVPGNGLIDEITVTMSEPLDDSDSDFTGTFTVDGYTVTSTGSGSGTDDATVVIVLMEGTSPTGDTGATPIVRLQPNKLSDGIAQVQLEQVFNGTVDQAPPAIFSATTVDNDGDGTVNRLTLIFSETITYTDTGDPESEMSLSATPGTASILDGIYNVPSGSIVTYDVLVSATGNTALTIDPTYNRLANGTIIDGEGLEMLDGETVVGADGAPAVIVSALTDDNDGDGTVDRLNITFSESMNIIDNGLESVAGQDFSLAASTGNPATIDDFDYNDTGTTTLEYRVTVDALDIGNTSLTIDPTYEATGPGRVEDISNVELTDQETVVGLDGAPPAVLSALTDDIDENGQVDQLTLTFSELVNINDGGTDNDFTLSSGAIDVGTYGNPSTNTVVYDVTGAAVDNTSILISPTYTGTTGSIIDISSEANEMNVGETVTGTDGAPPVIITAVTSDDGNGQIDEITVTFSENIDGGSVDTGGGGSLDFTTAPYTIFDVNLNGSNAVDIILTESGSPDTDATPNVTMNIGSITDGLPNNNTTSLLQVFNATDDGAAPVVIESISLDNALDGNVDEIELYLSEPVTDGAGDAASFTITPPVGFGAAQTSGTFSTNANVVGPAPVNAGNDEYISFTYSIDPPWGTGIMTMNYVPGGSPIEDGAGNDLSVPAIMITDGAAPEIIDHAVAGGIDLTLSPADDDTGVPSGSTISMRFSEEVLWNAQPSTNRIFFVQQVPPVTTEYNSALNTSDVDFTTSNGNASTAGTVTITVPTTQANTDYYTIIETGAFQDAANNTSPSNQFNTADFWDFQTETALVITNTSVSGNDITLTFNDDPTISVNAATTDFTVVDGIGNPQTVNSLTDPGATNDLILNVDLSGVPVAVGDLSINFVGVGSGGGTTDINAGVGTLQDFTNQVVDADTNDPVITASTTNGVNAIILTFDDGVQVVGDAMVVETFFSVEDGAMTDYPVTLVEDSIADNTLSRNQIRLSFATIASPSGDLFVTYTKTAGPDFISDYGDNDLETDTVQEELDGVAPTLEGVTILNNTQLELDFSEPLQIITASPANEFTVTDENLDTYIVAAITDAAPDDRLELTIQSIEDAVGDITVEYSNAGGVDIQDFGGNELGIISSATDPLDLRIMDVNLNPVPSISESFSAANNAIGDSDQGDVSDGSGIGMYRTDATVVVGTLQGYSPITITPRDLTHDITIYSDPGLTTVVESFPSVAGPISPTLTQLFEDVTNPVLDFTDGNDDSGVFTFYITETTNGASLTQAAGPTEGVPIEYSIALLDDVTNSAGGLSYGETDAIGTDITLSHPANHTLTMTGNGLASISYNPNATSSATFVPLAAGIGVHQLSFEWENDVTGVSAQFDPPEFDFSVNASSDVLQGSQTLAFDKTSTEAIIDMNNALTGLDVGESGDLPGPNDFYGYEVYQILNGSKVPGIGGLGINGEASIYLSPGGNVTDDIATLVLTYDSPVTGIDNRDPYMAGEPLFVLDEWSLDPSAFSLAFPTGNVVDTLRIVSISQADLGGSRAVIAEADIYLFPEPQVTIQGVNTFYCADDGMVDIQANIFTYVGTEGVDSTGFITNGYILNSGPADGGPYTLLDDRTGANLSNSFDPTALVPGFYQIEYTSLPQTDAGTIGTGTFNFEVRAIASAPELNLTAALDAQGGFDPGFGWYVFDFCSGETVPDLTVNTTTTPADPVGAGDTEYFWYDFEDQSLIRGPSATLTPNDLFGTTTPFGNIETDIYLTRFVNSCESDSVRIRIRIFEDPDTPEVDFSDDDVFVDNDDYYFEYCSDHFTGLVGDGDQGSDFDPINLASILGDLDGRLSISNSSYFEILNGSKNPIATVTYNAGLDATTSYSIDLNNAPYTTTGVDDVPSSSPSGIVDSVYYIVKHVADSSFTTTVPIADPQWPGCTSDTIRIFTRIYTVPDVPGFNDFTGTPHDLNGDGSVVQYYMCRNDDLDLPLDIGLNVPSGTPNFTYEWFEDAGATQLMAVEDREGERLTLSDLNTVGFDEAATSETPYTYYVRLVSNQNGDSGFGGCTTSGLRQVNITVFPDVVEPQVSLGNSPDLLSSATDVGNFDFEFNFCVEAGRGLDPDTEFISTVSYGGSQGEILEWFPANATGDGLIGTSIVSKSITEAPVDPNHTVTATELRIQNTENQTFNFGVIYNTERVPGFADFPGCFSIDTAYVRVNVSTTPATAYTFSGITSGETTTFAFFDDNGSAIAPNGVVFDIVGVTNPAVDNSTDPSRILSTLGTYQYSFPEAGIYDGTLTITTTAGCELIVTRRFQILEKIVVNGNYAENFDGADAGGWFAEFQLDGGRFGSIGDTTRISSWVHGVPGGTNLNSTFDGSGMAWTTTGNTEFFNASTNTVDAESGRYVGGEQSYVYSPAFDLSNMTNPAIVFRTFTDFDGIKDGVVFQFSLDDGVTWSPLGNFDPALEFESSGQDWYTASAISSSPGDASIDLTSGYNPNRVGWADRNIGGWLESTHALTALIGENNVRFRLGLGATGAFADDKTGDGFGFDELQIFELGRVVMIEQFSSSESTDSKTVNDTFLDPNPNIGIDDDGVMWLNYFTDFGNELATNASPAVIDEVNARNPTDPGARAAYYGVDDIPKSVIDGTVRDQTAPDQRSWAVNDINVAQLSPAFFDFPTITNTSTDPGILAVDFSFTSREDKQAADFSFIAAVVERRVAAANFGGIGEYTETTDSLRNVVRILLPGPAGFNPDPAETDIVVGQVFNFSVEWVIDNVYDASQLRVIVFAQDNETKEILQSDFLDVPSATESVLGLADQAPFSIYPNPGDKLVNVDFAKPLGEDSNWILYDQAGREVLKGSIRKGLKLLTIGTEDVPSGMYFLNVFNDENHRKVARVMISH